MARIICAGLGPGDPDLISVKADRVIRAATQVAYFRKAGRRGQARAIVEGILHPQAVELAMEYPVTTELAFDSPDYISALAGFYDHWADTLARMPGEVVVLCEGDPFFYGSFMHLYTRLKDRTPVEVIPGITGMAGCWHATGRTQFIDDVKQALYASKLCSYAQGYVQLDAAAKEFGWKLNNGPIALLWRGGCIIRSRFLEDIKKAFDKNPTLENLLLDDFFKAAISKAQPAWRRVVATAIQLGLPVPGFSAALTYYDGYRRGRLPANLLQAQRDYFGAHTYERTDKPRGEKFHTDWIRERTIT